MNKVKPVLLSAGILLALGFTFGCSGDDSPPTQQQENSSSSEGKVPNHCVYLEEKLCLHGANPCPGEGTPSEECPFQSSNSVSSSSANLGSSSAGEAQAKSSSSESEQSSSTMREQGYCVFEAEKICMEIETSCPSIATFSKTCPYSSSSSKNGQSSSSKLKECDAIFNPDNKFCYDGVVYDKCGGNSYIPLTQGCLAGKVEEKCGNSLYSQATQFCYDGVIYDKCDGMVYSPATHICQNGVATPTKCGDKSYNPLTQYCENGVATLAKCGDESYNPLTQRCTDGIVETKCGNSWFVYDQAMQFCYEGSIYDKCKGIVYSPASHICKNGVATPAKCNGESYNPLTQYCSNGTLRNYGVITDTRDGKKYKTVVIGNQTWMVENLNYATKNNYNNYCYGNCDKYGRLYNLDTAMKACPSGWHLPDDAEWEALITAVGGKSTAGRYLKATSGWDNNGNGEDKFGFSALPGGFGSVGGFGGFSVGDVGSAGYWWGVRYGDKVFADNRSISSEEDAMLSGGGDLRSVRCVEGKVKVFCNYGACEGGNGLNCREGGCFRMPTDDNCKTGKLVSTCPAGTKPPGADW